MAYQGSISNFIEDRLDKINNNQLPLKLRYSAKIVIHAIPTSMRHSFDIQEEKEKNFSMMRRIYFDAEKGMSYKSASLMESGSDWLSVGIKDEENPTENQSSVMFTMFNNAVFEYINTWIFRDYGKGMRYPYITYGPCMPMDELFNMIYVQTIWTLTHYQRLEINDDFLFKVSILGAKHYATVTDMKDPILGMTVDETRPKFDLEEYHFKDITFNYNPLSLGSQNDFDRTWTQIKGDIDPALQSFWNIDRVTFSDWMSQNTFKYKINEFLKILRSK